MNAAAVHPVMVREAGALVRRWRAGDENAASVLFRIGEEARKGGRRAQQAFQAVVDYVRTDPAEDYALVREKPMIISGEDDMLPPEAKPNPELRKPMMPRGVLDQINEPGSIAHGILRAAPYRFGLDAAALVLAKGPLLTGERVREIGDDAFGADRPMRAYLYGVQFSGEEDWQELAPQLTPDLRKCLAIGQCIGRARKIQAVRHPRSRISAYSRVAGWELGE